MLLPLSSLEGLTIVDTVFDDKDDDDDDDRDNGDNNDDICLLSLLDGNEDLVMDGDLNLNASTNIIIVAGVVAAFDVDFDTTAGGDRRTILLWLWLWLDDTTNNNNSNNGTPTNTIFTVTTIIITRSKIVEGTKL